MADQPAPLPDLTDLPDDDLAAHLNAVLAEQERRAAQASIPRQIADLAATYVAGGGAAEDLTLGI